MIVSEGEREERAVLSGSVKMLEFLPSNRRLWIVVGRDSEYWTDPDLGFCSCKDYYFSTLSGKGPCYHLKSVKKAQEDGGAERTAFSDSEYAQVLQALADDSEKILLH